MVLRGKGRPSRQIGGVGPATIVEAVRSMLRTRAKSEITRKHVALAANITPALVSYYFPSQTDLFFAAIDPLIAHYTVQLESIIATNRCGIDELRLLIATMIEFNRSESLLFDNYLLIIRDEEIESGRRMQIEASYIKVLRFMERLIENEGWQDVLAPWLTIATWGMCKSIAQTPLLTLNLERFDVQHARRHPDDVETVLSFVTRGVRTLAR